MNRVRRTVRMLVVLALAGMPGLLAGQQRASSEQAPDARQRWADEYEEVTRALEAIQERALRDPALAYANQVLGSEMKAAMEQADPGLQAELARVPDLESRARAAGVAADAAAMRDLTREIARIEARYRQAQVRAMRDPQLAGKVEAFHRLLQQRMVETDATAELLFARFRLLHARLSEESERPAELRPDR